VNSIFGEGVNPKFRKIRHGFDLLKWPSENLLQHGRQRILYGINLVENLLPYLLGVDLKPKYKFQRHTGTADVALISDWWMQRWLSRRIQSPQVLTAVAEHRSTRVVSHGARVPLPAVPLQPGAPMMLGDLEQPELY